MAKFKNGHLSGKMGDVIHSSWNGRPYTRRKPETVANPQTEAQQAHRAAFAEISRLSSAMKQGHSIGLHWHAVREKLNTTSVFRKLNKDCYGPDGIDYSRVKISKGGTCNVSITSAEVDGEGNMTVAFESIHDSEDTTNKLYVFVFCPDRQDGSFAYPVPCSDGVVTAQIPEEWRGLSLHLYAFTMGKDKRASDTIYYRV